MHQMQIETASSLRTFSEGGGGGLISMRTVKILVPFISAVDAVLRYCGIAVFGLSFRVPIAPYFDLGLY
jgi:hypothetical protein